MQNQDMDIKEIQLENSRFLPEVISLLDEGHTVTLRLKGYSMRPFLEHGRDKALMTKPTSLHVGDAVLAEVTPGHYVLHRIIKLEGEIVTLRGDGNLGVEVCRREDVKGFVIGFYRKGRNRLERTNSLKWHVYSAVWMALFPIRRYLLAAYRRVWFKLFRPI